MSNTVDQLICAIAPNGMPGAPFVKGFNNPRYHEELLTRMKKTIDACAEAGVPNVIAFTGYKWKDAEDPKSGEISRDEGAANCVKGLKELAGYAEKKKVTVCVEHLNTRAELGVSWVDDVISSLPASQRFFAGGDRSVRGFDLNELSPTGKNDLGTT